jgi:hypothetical protein
MFDLHFTHNRTIPLTSAGKNFLNSSLFHGPGEVAIYTEREYQDAIRQGLRVSFEDKDVLNEVTDPGSTSLVDSPCGADDNPDEAMCEDGYPNSDELMGE